MADISDRTIRHHCAKFCEDRWHPFRDFIFFCDCVLQKNVKIHRMAKLYAISLSKLEITEQNLAISEPQPTKSCERSYTNANSTATRQK